MKELLQLLAKADALRQEGQPFALATVVKIDGSTYRRPGARMLVAPDGATYGTLSGGCLEQEVAQQALDTLETGTPAVRPFDLSDDDLILGFGTGCNGLVHVLIEPVPAAERTDPTQLVQRCLDRRQTGLLAQVIDAPADPDLLGRRLLFPDDAPPEGDLADEALAAVLHAEAPAIREEERHQIRRYAHGAEPVEVLFEVVRPPIRLVIFGAGHDVGPLVRIAKTLGWPVTVVGRKPPDVLAERFPEADDHVFLMHPEDALEYVALDARSAAVVMNHQYARDKTLVRMLLQAPVPYVGALGPRERAERIIAELRAENPTLVDTDFDRLHGPVGLDLGTETPEEIALSMVAEIQAVHHGRQGGRLRDRPGAIHEAVIEREDVTE